MKISNSINKQKNLAKSLTIQEKMIKQLLLLQKQYKSEHYIAKS